MNCSVRAYTAAEVPAMVEIWNEVVRDGIAYPQENELDLAAGHRFFRCSVRRACGCYPEMT